MQTTKVAKLRTMVKRGTPGEQQAAEYLLNKAGVKPTSKAIAVVKPPKWNGDGVMRLDGGPPITTSQLRHFLNHIQDGILFTYKNIPFVDFFGNGHFYLIINFLTDHKLISKQGSKYRVDNKSAIRTEWNKLIEASKL